MKQSEVRKIRLHSEKLGKDMGICVYLPKCYSESTPLPVLYFLHGRSGDETLLTQLGIAKKADLMIEDGCIKPMIIVTPRIDNSRGMNSSAVCKDVPDGNSGRSIQVGMYEDYFIKEVIPFIDKTFRTIKSPVSRFVGGVSAGGYAALHYALRYSDLFSKAGGHMPAVELTLEEEDRPYFPTDEIWKKYDPITIAKETVIQKELSVYLDAGDQDEGEFYKGCSRLYDILLKKGIVVQNHIFAGHHNGEYIISNLEKYLQFYSD